MERRDPHLKRPLTFAERSSTIGIIGLGYVGLPLMIAAVNAGFRVVGFDINAEWVRRVNRGEQVIKHISTNTMGEALATGRCEATADFSRLGTPDALLICVPTPLTRHREPDLSHVEATAHAIAARLRPRQLVVLESTTYPGTTDEILKPVLEKTGLKSGVDFYLAYSPEREDPGNARFSTSQIPKVVGGDGPEALEMARALYEELVIETVPVSTVATAEAVKITENVFRAVNIALVNELKIVFSRMGIDIWEVVEAAKTKPFGFMPFYPGPGLGGHCIPIDPFYLTWKAREFDLTTRFIELAGEINVGMPRYVVDGLVQALHQRLHKAFSDARVLILGLAYKRNVDDDRESPSFKLIELVERAGASCDYHDPFIPEIRPSREHAALAGRRSVPLTKLSDYDAVVIATDHDCFDYAKVVAEARLVIDTRNACHRAGVRDPKIIKL